MEFIRNCPVCNKILTYSRQGNLNQAIKRNSICSSCGHADMKGENNPFYGKKHTEKTKTLLSEKFKGKSRSPDTAYGGKRGSPPNLKPVYEIWVEKYGIEEADRRQAADNERKSIASKGKNNPMYGKPAPQGSGNGWSGWYKGWYFRSLRELSYMIKVIEKENLKWKTTESKEFAIPYINYDGVERNYFPDFLLEGNRLIECKPKRLHASVSVLLKKEAAERYCLKRNWTYELLEPEMLSEEEILEIYKLGLIKFLPRYEEKFKEKYSGR